jgi:predicted ATPase
MNTRGHVGLSYTLDLVDLCLLSEKPPSTLISIEARLASLYAHQQVYVGSLLSTIASIF